MKHWPLSVYPKVPISLNKIHILKLKVQTVQKKPLRLAIYSAIYLNKIHILKEKVPTVEEKPLWLVLS